MFWKDALMLLFSCVAANHYGLIQAIEETLGARFKIINCSRCFSFWSVLLLMLISTKEAITSLATAFLCAALAPWLELLMGFIDKSYNEIYDKIFTAAEENQNTEAKTDPDITMS